MNKFLVIGPTMFDVSANINNKLKIKANISAGGKGYNIAHMLSLLKVPTILATMYGRDLLGNYLKEKIKERGIIDQKTNELNKPSSVFFCLNDEKGEMILDKADISIFKSQKLPKLNWRHINTVIVISSTSVDILKQLKSIKKKNPRLNFCLEIAGRKTIENILPFLTIFNFYISNYKEACELGNKVGIKDIKKTIKYLLSRGIKMAIITADKRGLFYGHGNKVELIANPSGINKPIISTVGAGDSITAIFCGLVFGYGFKVEEGINASLKVAAMIIRRSTPFLNKLPKDIIHKISK